MTTAAFRAELHKLQRHIDALKRMCDGSEVMRNHSVIHPSIEVSRDSIIKLVAAEFLIDSERVLGDCRESSLVTARHVAIYLLQKKHPTLSVVSIADLFRRDHSSISYANKAVNNRMDTEPAFKARIEKLGKNS